MASDAEMELSQHSEELDQPSEVGFPSEPADKPPQNFRKEFIRKRGDLQLLVGVMRVDSEHRNAVLFVVSSKALSRASKVWERLLYGGFAESKPAKRNRNEKWTVELPDDDPRAMRQLLKIVHGSFKKSSRANHRISLPDLYEITVLTDKYCLTNLIRPWAKGWIDSAKTYYHDRENWLEPPKQKEPRQLVWIAWELGDTHLFWQMITALARHYTDTPEAGTEFSALLEPPGIQSKRQTHEHLSPNQCDEANRHKHSGDQGLPHGIAV